MRKTEGLMKYPFVFLKCIRIQYDLMVVIFTISLQKWTWQKFVPVPLIIMGYHTVNVCCVVLMSAQVLSYPVMNQIKIQQTGVQQQYFMFTVILYVVLFMGGVHIIN